VWFCSHSSCQRSLAAGSISFVIAFCLFRATAPPWFYTLSLHDALPIYGAEPVTDVRHDAAFFRKRRPRLGDEMDQEVALLELGRSEEHTSELQSHLKLVCRLLLEIEKDAQDPPVDDVPGAHLAVILLHP